MVLSLECQHSRKASHLGNDSANFYIRLKPLWRALSRPCRCHRLKWIQIHDALCWALDDELYQLCCTYSHFAYANVINTLNRIGESFELGDVRRETTSTELRDQAIITLTLKTTTTQPEASSRGDSLKSYSILFSKCHRVTPPAIMIDCGWWKSYNFVDIKTWNDFDLGGVSPFTVTNFSTFPGRNFHRFGFSKRILRSFLTASLLIKL